MTGRGTDTTTGTDTDVDRRGDQERDLDDELDEDLDEDLDLDFDEGLEHDDADVGEDDGDRTGRGADDHGWSWHLARVSGLFLAVLVPLHFVVVMIVDDIGETTVGSMTERLRNITWRGVEWVTVMLALAHAFLALRALILASNRRDPVKEALIVTGGVAAVLLGLATSTIVLAYR